MPSYQESGYHFTIQQIFHQFHVQAATMLILDSFFIQRRKKEVAKHEGFKLVWLEHEWDG